MGVLSEYAPSIWVINECGQRIGHVGERIANGHRWVWGHGKSFRTQRCGHEALAVAERFHIFYFETAARESWVYDDDWFSCKLFRSRTIG